MSQIEHCRSCGKELNGALELKFFAFENGVIVVLRETSNCNWTRCRFCKKALCKRCYVVQRSLCSDNCFFEEIAKKQEARSPVFAHNPVKKSPDSETKEMPFDPTGSNGNFRKQSTTTPDQGERQKGGQDDRV